MSHSVSEGTQARVDAARILHRWLEERHYPEEDLVNIQTQRGFVMDLVYGVLRHYGALEWMIDELVDRAPPLQVRAHLLSGLYQLLFMDDVEAYAAIHETVEGARVQGLDRKVGFINAILRKAQREGEVLLKGLESQTLATRLSHPEALVDRWVREFGEADAAALCEWNNQAADVIVRLRDPFRDAMVEALIDSGARPHQVDGYYLCPRGRSVVDLPGFKEGALLVQDPATRHAVELLALESGMTVIDACAAPGGKTVEISDRVGDSGSVLALDSQDDRLDRLRENVARCGLGGVDVYCVNSRETAALKAILNGREVQRVLADVPCTNTGVFRRRADARWRFSERRLTKIRKQQRAILEGVAPVVAEGGAIVYSTCSLERDENRQLVAEWLGQHPESSIEEERVSRPWIDGVDGAYAVRLRRG